MHPGEPQDRAGARPAKRDSLVLFFAYGMSVRLWEEGLLDREKLIYERLLAAGAFKRIYWFSYGRGDGALLAQLKRDGRIADAIHVLEPPALLAGRLGRPVYSIVGPLFHRRAIASADILRTDQGTGAWTALVAKLLFSKPLLFRCGYVWSLNTKLRGEHLKSWIARIVEHLLLRFADAIMVTSQASRAYLNKMSPAAQIRIAPNYVDVADFKPVASHRPGQPILFVGRLVPIKNVDLLIRACARLQVPLHIFGNGPLRAELEALASELGADVTFKGVLPNRKMARAHHAYSVFVLCSTSEGMPKSLIEAMASGLICLGTDVRGINELIEDRVTGYLIRSPDADAIADALGAALGNFDPEVGARARKFVEDNHSLERAIAVELDMIARATKEADAAFTDPAA